MLSPVVTQLLTTVPVLETLKPKAVLRKIQSSGSPALALWCLYCEEEKVFFFRMEMPLRGPQILYLLVLGREYWFRVGSMGIYGKIDFYRAYLFPTKNQEV